MGLIEDIGRKIAELRVARGWTQEECAVRLHLTVRRLRRFETGTNLTVHTLERIARGLGVPVASLFERPQSSAPRPRGRPRKAPIAIAPANHSSPPADVGSYAVQNPTKRALKRRGAKKRRS